MERISYSHGPQGSPQKKKRERGKSKKPVEKNDEEYIYGIGG